MRYITLAIMMISSCAESIYEVTSMQEVYQYLPDDTDYMLICDIDNTLIHPTTDYGSDQWFSYQVLCEKECGYSHKKAVQRVLAEFIRFHHEDAVVQAIEDATIALLTHVHNNKIPVYAITSRSLPLVEPTHNQLYATGIVLTPDKTCYFVYEPEPMYFSGGVVFSSNHSKYDAMHLLIDNVCSELPNHIVFIDDKRKHVENVVNACHERGIPVTGIRYGYCDQFIEQFMQQS